MSTHIKVIGIALTLLSANIFYVIYSELDKTPVPIETVKGININYNTNM